MTLEQRCRLGVALVDGVPEARELAPGRRARGLEVQAQGHDPEVEDPCRDLDAMGAPVQRERVATQGAGDRRILDLQGLHFRPRRASLQRAVGGDRLGRVIGMGQGQAEGGGLARAGREQGHGALEIDLVPDVVQAVHDDPARDARLWRGRWSRLAYVWTLQLSHLPPTAEDRRFTEIPTRA